MAVVVVDCDIGNLQSVVRALHKIGGDPLVTSDPAVLETATHIVLPGVGSFDQGMRVLNEKGLLRVLRRRVDEDRVPLLGICLGHQMLTRGSEEGTLPGLGWIAARACRFPSRVSQQSLKVPHIGWSEPSIQRDCPLIRNIPAGACFYFSHSYYVECADSEAIVATAEYGLSFAAVVQRGNIFGVQFHPEKSQANGLTVLKNFLELR